MSNKKVLTLLGGLAIASLGVVCQRPALSVSATDVGSIIDDLDDTSKTSDAYGIFAQSGDVGFGADNRYISTKTATAAPTAATWWSEEYAYLSYSLSGQNAATVYVDTDPAYVSALPDIALVANYGGADSRFLAPSGKEVTASSNWSRIAYQFSIPDGAAWARVIFSVYTADGNGLEAWMQQITKVEFTYAAPAVTETIEDNLDDLSKTSDAYGIAAQSGDVGFGADTRYVSTKSPTAAPSADTWWSEEYAYLAYSFSGQNLATVVVDTDPSAVSVLPHIAFVANYGGQDSRFLEVNNYAVETSSNWSRITYKFIVPEGAAWGRVVFSVYNSYNGALATWMQQVTKVVLEHVDTLPEKDASIPVIPPIVETDPEPEPEPVVTTIEDNLDDLSKTNDAYGIAAQSGDVGFGADTRYVSTKSPAAAPSAETWWSEEYAYLAYTLSGQNLATVVVDVDPSAVSVLPHIAFVANYGGQDSRFLEVNNYAVETSSNWSRITYKFIIPEGAAWGRVIFSAYDSYDSRLAVWMQQITKVVIESVETLPSKDENIPVIEPIVKPDTPLEKVEDTLDVLDVQSNPNLADFYGVQAIDYEGDSVVGTTKSPEEEPTNLTWWEGVYGYVQFRVDERHNFMSVQAYVSGEVLAKCPDLMVYAGSGASLALVPVHSIVIGEANASGLYFVTYNYVLSGQSTARVVFTAYNAPDKSFTTSDQLLTKVTVDALETLPEGDPVDNSHDAFAQELRDYFASFDLTPYEDAEKALIKFYVNSGVQFLLHGKAADDAAYVLSVKEKIAAVQTAEQKFAAAKAAFVKELEDAYSAYRSEDYTEEDFARITKIYNDALAEIESSSSLEQIALIVSDAKEDMALVEKYVPVTLTSIAVSGAKAEFEVGEEFVTTGLKVVATYSDGTTADVTAEAIVDSSKVKMDTAGKYVVTVSYMDKSATYQITVKAAAVVDPEPTSRGCGGSVVAGASLVAMVGFLGLAVAAKAKKQD